MPFLTASTRLYGRRGGGDAEGRGDQRAAWVLGSVDELHANPMHISSVEPSPQVTK